MSSAGGGMHWGGSIDELYQRMKLDVATELSAIATFIKDRDPKLYAILREAKFRPPNKTVFFLLRFRIKQFICEKKAEWYRDIHKDEDGHKVYMERSSQIGFQCDALGSVLDGYAMLPAVVVTGAATGPTQPVVAMSKGRLETLTRSLKKDIKETMATKEKEEEPDEEKEQTKEKDKPKKRVQSSNKDNK